MALKPDRSYNGPDETIRHFMNTTGERGGIVVYDSSSSGLGGMDDGNSVVQYPTTSGGSAAGVLMNDVVNLDLTRQHINWHKDEVQINGKVAVLKKGEVRTNMLVAALNPQQGDKAFYTANGLFTNTSGNWVGTFRSAKDADGYAVVDVDVSKVQFLGQG